MGGNQQASVMKVLDCTLLAYEGPIFRAYLSVLKQLGYKVKRVVRLYNGHHRWPWIPNGLKQAYCANKEALEHNFYPQQFLKNAALSRSICQPIVKKYAFPADFFDIFGKKNLFTDAYAEECIYCDVEDDGWKSERLFALLQSFGPETYLFTGGGLVPRRILTLPGTEFVHVHPGFLPYTRGADGILWSIVARGKPGASCFYMVPQLDAGNVIAAEEFEPVVFQKPVHADCKTLYRLIFAFYDPAIRALCFKHVLEQFGTLKHLPNVPQDTKKGIVFHFMHEMLQQLVFRRMFV